MNHDEQGLRRRVREAWRREQAREAPAFDAVWSRAEADAARARHRYGWFAAAAVAAALVAVVLGTRPPLEEPTYIEMAELLNSTYWAAPSDALLPEHEFDIYEDMPELFEST